jgi:zinc transporter ZupT
VETAAGAGGSPRQRVPPGRRLEYACRFLQAVVTLLVVAFVNHLRGIVALGGLAREVVTRGCRRRAPSEVTAVGSGGKCEGADNSQDAASLTAHAAGGGEGLFTVSGGQQRQPASSDPGSSDAPNNTQSGSGPATLAAAAASTPAPADEDADAALEEAERADDALPNGCFAISVDEQEDGGSGAPAAAVTPGAVMVDIAAATAAAAASNGKTPLGSPQKVPSFRHRPLGAIGDAPLAPAQMEGLRAAIPPYPADSESVRQLLLQQHEHIQALLARNQQLAQQCKAQGKGQGDRASSPAADRASPASTAMSPLVDPAGEAKAAKGARRTTHDGEELSLLGEHAAEHGHHHGKAPAESVDKQKQLTKLSILASVCLVAHNIPEGAVSFIAALSKAEVGFAVALAIGLHNVAEGIVVSAPLFFATGSRWRALLLAAIAGAAEPLGALISYAAVQKEPSKQGLGTVFSIVAGMMTYLSLIELLPTARGYDPEDKVTSKCIIGGMFLMALSMILM